MNVPVMCCTNRCCSCRRLTATKDSMVVFITPLISRVTLQSTPALEWLVSGPGSTPAQPQNTCLESAATDGTSAVCNYAAVLWGRITDLARPSVCLSVPYGLLTQKLKGAENSKYWGRLNVPQSKKNRCASFNSEAQRSKVRVAHI